MNKGFELMRRHIDVLGARWGLMAEEAREATRELGIDISTRLVA